MTGIILLVTAATLAIALTSTSSTSPSASSRSSGSPRYIGRIVLPSDLYAEAPAGSPSLVTPALATTVAHTMWSLRERALVDGNNDAIRELDVSGGPLAASDLTACGCSRDNVPMTYSSLVTLVPTQTTYPLDFMAEYQSTTMLEPTFNGGTPYRGPWDVIEVITKASATSSWRVAFASGFSNIDASANIIPFRPPPGAGPYDDVATIQPPVPVDQLPGLLAAYWQSYKDVGHAPVPTPFLAGSDSTEFGDYIAESPQGTLAGEGSRVTFAYSADPARDGIWSFPVQPGDDLATCSAVRVVATYVPTGQSALVQGAGRFFGAGLSPGHYSKIEDTTLHESCILTASNGLAVFGTFGYDTSDVGVPSR